MNVSSIIISAIGFTFVSAFLMFLEDHNYYYGDTLDNSNNGRNS